MKVFSKKIVLFIMMLVLVPFTPVFAQNEAVEPTTVDCDQGYCASSTNPIVASYSTMAYWTLNGLLKVFGSDPEGGVSAGEAEGFDANAAMVGNNSFRMWGALIYMLSVIAAIVMMAMGQPPKLYAWWAAGPALFYFLLFTTVERLSLIHI